MSARGRCIRRSLARQRRAGTVYSSDRDRDHTYAQDLAQCAHCGLTWVHTPGSGRIRGTCGRCLGLVCGPKCPAGSQCKSKHQMIEDLEAGRPADAPRPTVVSTAGLILPG